MKKDYVITGSAVGLSITEFVRTYGEVSAREFQRLIRSGNIRCNGRKAFSKYILKDGDQVSIHSFTASKADERARTSPALLPQEGSLNILYEDDHCLVVNKPPFMLVHPAGATRTNTLSNYLAAYYQKTNQPYAVRPIHRLDRDTSGCVLFAKTSKDQQLLEKQLAQGQISRIYRALTDGRLTPLEGIITTPIGSDPKRPNRRQVRPDGKPAVTAYQVLNYLIGQKDFTADCTKQNSLAADPARGENLPAPSAPCQSLVELRLATGRTHQIRVHLASLGHPVTGDAMYGKRHRPYTRQCLHAYSLSFYPLSAPAQQAGAEVITVLAPLPQDFGQEPNFTKK